MLELPRYPHVVQMSNRPSRGAVRIASERCRAESHTTSPVLLPIHKPGKDTADGIQFLVFTVPTKLEFPFPRPPVPNPSRTSRVPDPRAKFAFLMKRKEDMNSRHRRSLLDNGVHSFPSRCCLGRSSDALRGGKPHVDLAGVRFARVVETLGRYQICLCLHS